MNAFVSMQQVIRIRVADCSDDRRVEKTVFGKPSAPREMYQKYADMARNALLESLQEGGTFDVLEAALQIAAEDDAIKTQSVVQLPVQFYVRRRDRMADEFAKFYLPTDRTPQTILRALEAYMFDTMKYKLAVNELEVFSSYRTYTHHVLAQKCGNGVGLAVVLGGMVKKLQEQGVIDFDVSYVVPGHANTPMLVLGAENNLLESEFTSVSTCFNRPVSDRVLVYMLLDSLKKFFWPWDWPSSSESGFLPAAEAAVSNSRVGTAAAGTGIIQPSGRPFGDLERALLSTERLVDCGVSSMQLKDKGVLLYHLKRYEESYQAFQEYVGKQSLDGLVAPPEQVVLDFSASDGGEREAALLQDMLARLPLLITESHWSESSDP